LGIGIKILDELKLLSIGREVNVSSRIHVYGTEREEKKEVD